MPTTLKVLSPVPVATPRGALWLGLFIDILQRWFKARPQG